MPKRKKLCVEAVGRRRFIDVPTGRAMALHDYLRNHRVASSPPEPAYTGLDSIELPGNVDVEAVQNLLDAWK